jgi:hypothetical protein
MTEAYLVGDDERDAAPASARIPLADVWVDRDLGWVDFNRRVLVGSRIREHLFSSGPSFWRYSRRTSMSSS